MPCRRPSDGNCSPSRPSGDERKGPTGAGRSGQITKPSGACVTFISRACSPGLHVLRGRSHSQIQGNLWDEQSQSKQLDRLTHAFRPWREIKGIDTVLSILQENIGRRNLYTTSNLRLRPQITMPGLRTLRLPHICILLVAI